MNRNQVIILAIIGLIGCMALLVRPDLSANIFFGNKGKATYKNSGVQSEVERSVWMNSKVQDVVASDGESTNYIKITWNHLKSGSVKPLYYMIYRSMSENGDYIFLANGDSYNYEIQEYVDCAGLCPFYYDSTAKANQQYYYKIQAFNHAYGKNQLSDSDSGYVLTNTNIPLQPPNNVNASDGTNSNYINVTWDPVPEAYAYIVYRSLSEEGIYTEISLNITTNVFQDSSANKDTKYYYKIVSVSILNRYSSLSTSDSGIINYFHNSMLPEMISIPAVTSFSMGRPNWEEGDSDEQPVHAVNLKAFSISKFEITYKEFVHFLNFGENDEYAFSPEAIHNGYTKIKDGHYTLISGKSNHPVVNLEIGAAQAYCNWLSERTGKTYRLPTEAEWEYAAVGTNGHRIYPWGNTWVDTNANWADNGGDGSLDGYQYAAPVGTYENGKSPFGLYDMAGNVAELCLDYYNATYYSVSPVDNPQGPLSGTEIVVRGGSQNTFASGLRCSSRNKSNYGIGSFIGFRIIRTD